MRPLLITLDAFNTLITPRLPIPAQYASSAAKHNIPLSASTLQPAFRSSFKALSASHPNYGRELALRGDYAGPRQWWEDVIRGCFERALRENDSPDLRGKAVPDALVEDLLDRFASKRGYRLFDDVGPFLKAVRAQSRKVVIGVVSNSDDRISSVLDSLGVSVRDARAGEEKTASGHDLPGFEGERETKTAQDQHREQNDIDFILTSYQVGAEKPDPLIWDVATRTANRLAGESGSGTGPDGWECIHIGDDYGKDYRGAGNAGWGAYYLARDAEAAAQAPEGTRVITSLLDLLPKLGASDSQQ
ncbi:uncharacterized protein DSM5745_07441 [Aspergillus mulundensis]|uniref:Haloacid dehalogenase-like hydrolase n=1 Tax=Aspergillus mulundensis TaxID=1810919 RepID=A0A3D8RE07_9EURO|nr:Uncharacterized protein DSM5745_07441 [Aspergillus mulundensis]RDW72269.1 Uncharacterized protein DSM5745_07441 [Aspergillus mulundensis]